MSRAACQWGLYVITDETLARKSHIEIARAALAGGARVIQLRDKTASFEDLVTIAHKLRELTREADATFIVNDNPYLAREVDADGVHLGQTDFPAYIAREVMGPDKIIGISTHTKQQALAAQTHGIDYIGVGPIYQTSTKKSEYDPVGLHLIRWVKRHVSLPVVAIGGISEGTVPDVVAAGADNVACISELMTAVDIQERTRSLIRNIKTVSDAEP